MVSEWTGTIAHAGAIPEPCKKGAKDLFRGDRPRIVILYTFPKFASFVDFHFGLGWTL
jgi:hypothetical protein